MHGDYRELWAKPKLSFYILHQVLYVPLGRHIQNFSSVVLIQNSYLFQDDYKQA